MFSVASALGGCGAGLDVGEARRLFRFRELSPAIA
jgi:hypothetical protein